jgi:hypothetical protein
MDKPPRLKEESEKLVSNNEQGSTSNALQTVGGAADAQPAAAQLADAQADEAQPRDAKASVAAPVQILRDSAAEREAKKLADQEFLAAYKKHELFLRIRFGVIVILLLGTFAVSVPKFFAYIDSEKRVIVHLNPAVSAALLGEKDAAYYQTSQLPIPEDQNNGSDLVKSRKKILDKTIAELEGGGRTAIFSRLGAEQLLMRANQRETGFKYGDYLINKYPNLPSNYLVRAEVDLDRGDLPHAIAEYDQFFALIKNATLTDKEAWQDSIQNAIWGCIDYGRVDKAKEYFETYKNLGVHKWQHKWDTEAIRQSILLAEYDLLDIAGLKKTSFWNSALEKHASNLMNQVKLGSQNSFSPLSGYGTEQVGIYTRARDFKSAYGVVKRAESIRYMGYRFKYRYAVVAADFALAMDRPKDAIAAIDEYEKEFDLSSELYFLLAQAHARMHETHQAIKAADAGLVGAVGTQSPGVYSPYRYTNYRLSLLLIKARALFDSGKLESALQICNQVMETSPDMIAPKLLKLEIMQNQGNQQEVSKLRAIISSQLEKVIHD